MIRRLTPIAFLITVILAASWPMLSGDRFAFRDVSHFYLPLYDYIAHRTESQWIPLWNPLDHTGMPLVGESSTAVLYPVRYAVYSLPISSESAMNVYLLFHLLLASATSALLAAKIGCRTIGVITAGIVYPLSGSVYSLCCNPPFLVGAAWLPLAFAACLVTHGNRTFPGSRRGQIVVAAIALSMMVLGGDPQSALHSVLVVVFVSAVAMFNKLRLTRSLRKTFVGSPFVASVLICVTASCLAIALSAVQIAASLDWSQQSSRLNQAQHRLDLYEFSLAPWHALELVSSRPFGHPFPLNQQFSKLIPGEGRMWTPSIYAGLVVGFALLCRLLKPRDYFLDPWLSIAMVSLLICFGHFGLVWALQQMPGVLTEYDSAVGGPYWLLCKLVPGYGSFRYPVKWLPVFMIAASMVTAQWISNRPVKSERGVAAFLAVLLACGAAGFYWATQNWARWYDPASYGVPVDEYWGPLDIPGGLAIAMNSCLWSLLVLLILALLRWVSSWQTESALPKWVIASWLVFVAVDSATSASRLLPRVSIDDEVRLVHQASPSPIAPMRTLRTQAGLWPSDWQSSGSSDRALSVAVSERMAWFGRWHLAERHPVFNSMVSIQSRAYAQFWSAARSRVSSLDRESQSQFWSAVRQWLVIDAMSHVDASRSIAADGHSLVFVVRIMTEPVDEFRVYTDWRGVATMPQIVSQLATTSEPPLPHVAIGPPVELAADSSSNHARWSRMKNGAISVFCNTPCLLERGVYQDGNWSATLVAASGESTVDATVHRSSLLKQAVEIPPGNWLVSFQYSPWWMGPAILVSCLAAISLTVLACFPLLRSCNNRAFGAR